MLETIHEHWQLLATLLAVNLTFLIGGVKWPQREKDIREHPQWPEVGVLVDRYITIALPDRADSEDFFARDDAARMYRESSDLSDFFHSRPAAYVVPEAEDAIWQPIATDPAPSKRVERATSAAENDASPVEQVDPNQIAFAFAEFGMHAPHIERGAREQASEADELPEPPTFVEWFALRERRRVDEEVQANAGSVRVDRRSRGSAERRKAR